MILAVCADRNSFKLRSFSALLHLLPVLGAWISRISPWLKQVPPQTAVRSICFIMLQIIVQYFLMFFAAFVSAFCKAPNKTHKLFKQ